MSYLTKMFKPFKKAKKDTHYWADYIELLCMVNKDGAISQKDFIDRIKPQRDEEDNEIYDTEKTNEEFNTANSRLAEDSFILLEYRLKAFEGFYPFKLSSDKRSLHFLNQEDLKFEHKLYIFLLLSSSLGIFIQYKTALTSSFEKLSLEVLKKILPQDAKAILFGSSNVEELEEGSEEQNSLFWDKIGSLSENIRERISITKEELSQYNKGDGGLDIYGWIELGDNNRHFPLYFCQCACTPEWPKKQNSSKFDRWNNFITLSVYPHNVIFIPFSFRRANGSWHEEHAIEKSVLMDRQRMLFFLKNNAKCFSEYESYEIVNEVISQKESVV